MATVPAAPATTPPSGLIRAVDMFVHILRKGALRPVSVAAMTGDPSPSRAHSSQASVPGRKSDLAPTPSATTAPCAWLEDREPGALVQFNDEVRFYPLSILTRHEIVNDRYGDVPVAVTFCPLCNTALTFDRRVDGEVLRFGVSGLLRKSDLVMWDDATTSLWQQITGEGRR